MRLLLNNRIGPTSFEDLKIVNNISYNTYQEACLQLGLIGNDQEWTDAMNESQLTESPFKMRNLFAIILSFCEINTPKQLWEAFWKAMGEDFEYKIRNNNNNIPNEQLERMIYGLTYNEINKTIFSTCGKLLSNFSIEPPDMDITLDHLSLLLQEQCYNCEEEKEFVNKHLHNLNSDQSKIYNRIFQKLFKKENGLIFIDAPGGTGKTYLLNLIRAKVRSEGKIVASSGIENYNYKIKHHTILTLLGIASTLLRNGKTAHRTFKLPLNLSDNEYATCDISPNSDNGKLLKECSIIIWDEAPMMHKHGFEALNRTLQDVRNNKQLMGGILVVLSGDFRQIVKGGTKYDEIKVCIKLIN